MATNKYPLKPIKQDDESRQLETPCYTELFEHEGRKMLRLCYPDNCGQAMYDCFLKDPIEMQKLLESWISCWENRNYSV